MQILPAILAALLVAISAPASAQFRQWWRPSDPGGSIGDRILEIAAAGGRRHEIIGDCASACTMWLGARGVCVWPDAALWFHSARPASGNDALRTFYPPKVRNFVDANGYLDSYELRPIYGWQLIKMGIRDCSKPIQQRAKRSQRRK